MSSFIKIQVLSGGQDENHLCYILSIDQARILLDCGWNERFDPNELNLQEIKDIDAILISHADLDHMGGLVYCYSKLGLNCPIYCTTPVHDMGMLLFKDILKSKRETTDFTTFTLQDIETTMQRVIILRYSQPISLQNKAQGIIVTPFGAGHTIGGTVWKIRKDTEDIIYTVDFNHRKERHLNGSALLTTEALAKPSLLITDSLNAAAPNPPPRKERDADLIQTIMSTLENGGNVLLPVESTTRSLELAYLLDGHWAFNRIPQHLIFLSNESVNTVNAARSMLEWMGDGISQAFAARELPFDFKHLKLMTSLHDAMRLEGPKVVLASFPGLEFGFSRQLFLDWGTKPENCVILTDKTAPETLGRQLYDQWVSITEGDNRKTVQLNLDLELNVDFRIPLEGDELEAFLAQQVEQEENEEILNQEVPNADNLSDMDEDLEEEKAQVPFDIYINETTEKVGFFKQEQEFKMFPVTEIVNPKFDDYGEVIDIAEFKKFEVKLDDVEMGIEPPKKEVIPEIVEIPSRFLTENIPYSFRCQLRYIDFEGRSDARSLRNILQYVSPKRLVLVHGSQKACQELKEFCLDQESTITQEIYTPSTSETVDVKPTSNIFQVLLTDSLVSSMRFAKLEGYKLGYVSGVIRAQDGNWMLDLQPLEEQKAKMPVSVGDIKLSELKKQLGAQGFTTQFVSGGVLVVNDSVVIQKTDEGKLAIQGQLNDDYYSIRDIVYSFQATL